MQKIFLAFVLLIVGGFLSSTASANVQDGDRFWVPGFTLGTRTGMTPRAGLDLTLMTRKGQGDGISGCGAIVGTGGIVPFEYYVGAACGGAYMFSMWGEVTANFVQAKPTGLRALAAVGFGLMPYVALGYDNRTPYGPFAELGLTFKIPLF